MLPSLVNESLKESLRTSLEEQETSNIDYEESSFEEEVSEEEEEESSEEEEDSDSGESSESAEEEKEIVVKFIMDRVVRKFNISSLITFQELKTFVVNENIAEPIDPVLCKDIDVLKLEYEDDEKDMILIASQREWQTAIEPWRHGTRNDSFRVKISLNRKNPK